MITLQRAGGIERKRGKRDERDRGREEAEEREEGRGNENRVCYAACLHNHFITDVTIADLSPLTEALLMVDG
jgi:hypothetical protein